MEDSGFKKEKNVAVVGLGLIGGSFAMALKKAGGGKVIGIDRDRSVIGAAIEMGVIDKGYTTDKVMDGLKQADVVVMALYPHETVEFVKNNLDAFKRGAVITDTCGIKNGIIDKINDFLPEHLDFVGGHPMAGKESEGLLCACDDLFKNSNYIITPVQMNKYENIRTVEGIARRIGCKNVVSISPEEHDRIITFTSQLPHVIAVSLMNSNNGVNLNSSGNSAEGNLSLFTAGSFKDVTRVANINSTLWSQLFLLNSKNLLREIERFEDSIKAMKQAIVEGDKGTLVNLFSNATTVRRKLV